LERDERLEILKGLPKVDLHRHFEGAIRPSTMVELGRKHGLDLPLGSLDALIPEIAYVEGDPRTLKKFLTKFHCDWYRSYGDIERISAEIVKDAFGEGVVHLELRFSPEHLTRTSRLDPLGAMKAVRDSAAAAASDLGVSVCFIVTFTRERYDFRSWKRVVDHAAEMSEEGFAGVDLAGDEFSYPNRDYEKIFRRVLDTGVLWPTIHAGEGTDAAHVAEAVSLLGAKRIGHGVASIQDPRVMDLLIERKVALEMCPISNYQTGCVDDLSEHPLPELDRAGVPVTLNSDDPTIHRSDINDEYDVAVALWGYSLDDLLRLEKNAVAAAFLPEEGKEVLLERIEKGYQESRGQGLS
jgi:adenosine deaminase